MRPGYNLLGFPVIIRVTELIMEMFGVGRLGDIRRHKKSGIEFACYDGVSFSYACKKMK